MQFVIMEKYGSYVVEAEDIESALQKAYSNHNGYADVYGIVKIPDDE